jgi:hypothetical protein
MDHEHPVGTQQILYGSAGWFNARAEMNPISIEFAGLLSFAMRS